MSFAEIMIVLAVLGVMALFMIVAIRNVVPSAQEVAAENNLNLLNAAVLKFNQANWELVLTADSLSAEDETAIFRSLQYRHPTHPSPGSPYLSQTQGLTISNDASLYRGRWNGRMYEMLPPGAVGVGLDLARMSDSASSASLPSNFKPVGAR